MSTSGNQDRLKDWVVRLHMVAGSTTHFVSAINSGVAVKKAKADLPRMGYRTAIVHGHTVSYAPSLGVSSIYDLFNEDGGYKFLKEEEAAKAAQLTRDKLRSEQLATPF